MEYLKQSTAFTETIGPILDSTGAEFTTAVIGDLSISKNGTEAAMAAAATLTHVSNGHYTLVGTTGNSDTLGRLTIRVNKSTYQMPPKVFMVLPATVYDAIVTNATNTNGGFLAATAATSVGAFVGNATAAIAVDASGRLDMGKILGTAISTPATAGILDVNLKNVNNVAYGSSTLNTLASHDPGATIGTSTLTQTQVTGGAYALNSASFAFNAGLDFTTTQKAATLARVTLTDTVTTYTGNTVQTGDSFARIGATGSGLTSLAQASLWNSTRAGYVDMIPTIKTSLVSETATVNDASATTTSFVTNLTSAVDDFYNDALITFTSGALTGQSRPILDYNGTTKAVTVSEALTSAPANGVSFSVVADHIHPVTQIAAGVLTAAQSAPIYADTRTVEGTDATNYFATLDDATLAAIAALNNITAASVVTAMGTGTFLTAIPWNAAWDAEVQSEAEDAIIAHRLDELLNADSDIDGAAPPTVGSVFHELMSKTAGSFTFDQTTDSNEALRDRGDAAWITATGFSTLDAAGVRTAVGLASANLDTQLGTLATASALASLVTTVGVAGAGLTAADDAVMTYLASNVGTNGANLTAADDATLAAIAALNNLSSAQVTAAVPTVSQIWTTALTEAYKTAGATGTAAQLLYEILQNLTEFANTGTTRTVKKLDGTTAKTYTYDSASAPTSITETT